jgi:hypothetical protein
MLPFGAPGYDIDLALAEEKRWASVIAAEAETARELVNEAAAEFRRVPEPLRWFFARLYKTFGGLYSDEIKSWARGIGESVGTVTMLNCAYELSQLRWPRLFGCTAGVCRLEDGRLVHVRSLDWPLECMGDATRLFRFRRDGRQFVAVGVPGQVGILSGMVPQAYSITINWAPPAEFPNFEFGPTFLLRHTLETCDTFEAACARLMDTVLSTSVFFTLCGTKEGEACVIERTQGHAEVRPLTGTVLVQANHHVAQPFVRNNKGLDDVAEEEKEEFSRQGSGRRALNLEAALSNLGASNSLTEVAAALDSDHVCNKFTCQQIAFFPATGEVMIWRRLPTRVRVTPKPLPGDLTREQERL